MSVRFAEFASRSVVQRRIERRWELRAGARTISFSHVRWDQAFAQGADPRAIVRHAGGRPRRPISTALAAMLVLVAGATLVGFALQSFRASARGSYSVSLFVPPAKPGIAPIKRVSARPTPAAHAVRTRTTAARPVEAAVANDEFHDEAAVTSTPSFSTRQRALDAALTTGSLQQWAEAGGRYGYVVAGLPEADSARQCRQLSILTREAGEADQVDVQRSCAPLPK